MIVLPTSPEIEIKRLLFSHAVRQESHVRMPKRRQVAPSRMAESHAVVRAVFLFLAKAIAVLVDLKRTSCARCEGSDRRESDRSKLCGTCPRFRDLERIDPTDADFYLD